MPPCDVSSMNVDSKCDSMTVDLECEFVDEESSGVSTSSSPWKRTSRASRFKAPRKKPSALKRQISGALSPSCEHYRRSIIKGLPEQLCFEVLKFLNRFDLTKRANLVNKAWMEACKHNCVWRERFQQHFPQAVKMPKYSRAVSEQGAWRNRYHAHISVLRNQSHRSSGWGNYVDNHIVRDGEVVQHGCIFGYQNGILLWARSPVMRLTEGEMQSVSQCFTDHTIRTMHLCGQKYIIHRSDDKSVYMRSFGDDRPDHGYICCKTLRAVLMGRYDCWDKLPNAAASMAADIVENLAEYLIDHAY